ncbi:MAG TPA: SCO family protein [Candidatus Acidoferrum sp.]|nr:SCO family protein [Candidatus Acidoferrum sp.]
MEPAQPKRNSHLVEYLIWGALAATIVGIAVAFLWTRFGERLQKPLVLAGNVPQFTLTNQLGQPLTLTNLLGHVWIADVIFTRCPMSCERMTQRMRALQDHFGERSAVKFVSITADPVNDAPEVLRKYADRHGADPSRWWFLTGTKMNVYELAVDGLKFIVRDKTEEKLTPDDLFLHSTQFVLVDKQGRIRGYYEGTEENERKQLAIAVKKLQRER